jgi:hypothetical protein
MVAFVTDCLWSRDDLFDAVTAHVERKRKDARLQKVIDRLENKT